MYETLFQYVPEARSPMADLEEALRFHGLTREKMEYELIRWVESVRLENPTLYEQIIYDPYEIKPYIVRYDFVFSTGMTVDYPRRRGWDDWMAIREFIQNALDIEEKMFGYENIKVDVFVDDLGTHVADRGPGITIDAFKVGGSDKGCADRGYFGEGMKVAAAYFAGEGYPVYVFTRKGQVYKAFVPYGSNLLLVALGRATRTQYGTEVIIHDYRFSPEKVSEIVFQKWLEAHPEVKILTRKKTHTINCPVDKPNTIVYVDGGMVDKLWVRDIYVNTLSHITGRKAIFGYNLWWPNLEPNRRNVSSLGELTSEAAEVFTPEAIRKLLGILVARTDYGATVETGYFETDEIDWWFHAPEEVRDEVAKFVEELGLGVTYDKRVIDWLKYLGISVLYVPDVGRLKYLFSKAPTAEKIAVKKAAERASTASATAISEETLTFAERCILAAAKIIVTYTHTVLTWGEKPPEIVVSREIPGAAGMVKDETIYISRKVLSNPSFAFETAIHEYSHIYGKRVYGAAPDISEAFEEALGRVSSTITLGLIQYDYFRRTVRRALEGGFGAHLFEWEDKTYVQRMSLIEEALRYINENIMNASEYVPHEIIEKVEGGEPPCVIYFIATGDTIFADRDLRWSRETVKTIIPQNVVPDRELYMKKVSEIAEKYIRENIKYGVSPAIYFIYDPWKDKYVFYRKI